MTDYLVVYERADDGGWNAYAAELPVFVVGDTRDEAEREIRNAIAFYLETLREDGGSVPEPHSLIGTVTV